jgi:hypothetical protein
MKIRSMHSLLALLVVIAGACARQSDGVDSEDGSSAEAGSGGKLGSGGTSPRAGQASTLPTTGTLS